MKIFNAAYQTPGEQSGYNPTEVYLIAVEDDQGEDEARECLEKKLKQEEVKQYAMLDVEEMDEYPENYMSCIIARNVK